MAKKVEIGNKKVWDHNENLLHLFDDFNDNKSSKRIIEYILKYEL